MLLWIHINMKWAKVVEKVMQNKVNNAIDMVHVAKVQKNAKLTS